METETTICEVSINYQSKSKLSALPVIIKASDAVHYFREIWSEYIEYKEQMYVLLLNRANRVIGYSLLASGGTSECLVDVKMLMQLALKTNSNAFILAHNHPSGNLKPSNADIELTKKIKAAGKFMEIHLLDHMVITKESYYSFADEGML